MPRTHILALDQGTTSSRAVVFDHAGNPVAVGQREFPQLYPRPGWVEHDPLAIWASQWSTAVEALGKADLVPEDIAAMVLFLASDDARLTTGHEYWVDAGWR